MNTLQRISTFLIVFSIQCASPGESIRFLPGRLVEKIEAENRTVVSIVVEAYKKAEEASGGRSDPASFPSIVASGRLVTETVSLYMYNKTFAEILMQLTAATRSKMIVEGDAIIFEPIEDDQHVSAERYFAISSRIAKRIESEAANAIDWFRERGVSLSTTDRIALTPRKNLIAVKSSAKAAHQIAFLIELGERNISIKNE